MNYIRLPALVALALTVSACGIDVHDDCPALCHYENAPIITNLIAEPETVTAGASSTLTWAVSGDDPVLTIEVAGARPVTVTNETSYVARPILTTTYILVAENAAGRVQNEVIVNVNVTSAEPRTP